LLHLVGRAQQTEMEKEEKKKKKKKKKKKAGRKQGQYSRSQKGGASLPGPPKITARPDNGHALSHLR
jgi:hypothetical protein